MYFVSKFLEYTAVKGSTNLNKIITLDPRDPQVDVDGDITVTFNSAPTGKVFCFIEKLETASTVGDVTGTEVHDTVLDPYIHRRKVLFTFTGSGTQRVFNLNLGAPNRVGTMVFFQESSIVTISKDIHLISPYRVELQPRTLVIQKVDGSTYERTLDDENKMSITMNFQPLGDYKNFSTALQNFFTVISPRSPFLFVGEEHTWDMYLLKPSPERRISHNRVGYNRQTITALNLEVA